MTVLVIFRHFLNRKFFQSKQKKAISSVAIGGFRGDEEDIPSPFLADYSISKQILGKIGQRIRWRPLWGWRPSPVCEILDPPKTAFSGGSRISPRWGANPLGEPMYDFVKFSQKLHEIERIWTRRGEFASKVFLCRSATGIVYLSAISFYRNSCRTLFQNALHELP